jgi:hypothetical protein
VITGPTSAVPRYLSVLLRSGTPAALSDSELLERFASRHGEHDETAELAFAALLARHGPMVLRVCRAVLGDRHEVVKLMIVTAAVSIAGLVTAGAGVSDHDGRIRVPTLACRSATCPASGRVATWSRRTCLRLDFRGARSG